MNKIDWYEKLKFEIIELSINLKKIKLDTVFLFVTNQWVFEDCNLIESFTHLLEMFDISYDDLSKLVKLIYQLDSTSTEFNKIDLLDEFDFIKENINIEFDYLSNIEKYLSLVDNYTIDVDQINEIFDEYYENDNVYYNQMKINNENLKLLRKERRDYFE